MKSTVCNTCWSAALVSATFRESPTHLAVVVLVQNPASGRINLLVALAGTTTAQGGIHVHVMASHVQANQSLENNGPPRPGRAQKNKQTSGCATIRHHVKHGTKGGRLVEISGGISIQGVQ